MYLLRVVSTLAFAFIALGLSAQDSTDYSKGNDKMYVVIKNDGTEFVGKILKQDAREILMDTKRIGQVIIPKHEVKEIRELSNGEVDAKGDFVGTETFSTRYFITTNGLSLGKGESYILWNLYGPEFQFGITNRFSIGLMTTWIAIPMIGTAKYTFDLGKNVHAGIGTLLGTGSWVKPSWWMALPYGVITFGDSRRNISFSGGYGGVSYSREYWDPMTNNYYTESVAEGRALFSVSGLYKAGKKISIVFDSFIFPSTQQNPDVGGALLIPGLRFQMQQDQAFQFGFAALNANNKWIPLPIPMVQWFRKL